MYGDCDKTHSQGVYRVSQKSVVLTNVPGIRCTFLDIVPDEHLSQIDSNGLRRD